LIICLWCRIFLKKNLNNKSRCKCGKQKIDNISNPQNGADAVNLSTLNDFKQLIIKYHIPNIPKISEDISKCAKIYLSHDNILTRVNDKGLLVKKSLKVTNEDIKAEIEELEMLQNQKGRWR